MGMANFLVERDLDSAMELIFLRFGQYMVFTSVFNLMLYAIDSRQGTERNRLRRKLMIVNTGMAMFLFVSGPQGLGTDWPSFVPPLIWIVIWFFVLKPKPPPRKRWRKKVKEPAKKTPGYAGTRLPHPA
jgi:hypothetical protein